MPFDYFRPAHSLLYMCLGDQCLDVRQVSSGSPPGMTQSWLSRLEAVAPTISLFESRHEHLIGACVSPHATWLLASGVTISTPAEDLVPRSSSHSEWTTSAVCSLGEGLLPPAG